MKILYIGDSGDIWKRVRKNHCSGNLRNSALRRHVAVDVLRLPVVQRKDLGGKSRMHFDHSSPETLEEKVSLWLQSRSWKHVTCFDKSEAVDFQYYAIEMLSPLLNAERRSWNLAQRTHYEELLGRLKESNVLSFCQLDQLPRSPGVYILLGD